MMNKYLLFLLVTTLTCIGHNVQAQTQTNSISLVTNKKASNNISPKMTTTGGYGIDDAIRQKTTDNRNEAKGWLADPIDYDKMGNVPPVAFRSDTKLVKVTFEVPKVGVKSHKVSMEGVGGKPDRIFEAGADGITYHLPEGQEVWFELKLDEEAGYFVTHWLQNGVQVPYSSHTTERAVKAREGLSLKVEVERKGTTYLVEFEQPEGATLVCKNRSVDPGASDVINSGDRVHSANNILFEVSPADNPNGTVDVKHWEINGYIYEDAVGDPITNNSIEFKLLHDVKVKVVLASNIGVSTVSTTETQVVYAPQERSIRISSVANCSVVLYSLQGVRVANAVANTIGITTVDVSQLRDGIYIAQIGNEVHKILIY